MKHGKKPTIEQRRLMEHFHMNSNDWLVVKDTPEQMEVVHRLFDTRKVIPKAVRDDG